MAQLGVSSSRSLRQRRGSGSHRSRAHCHTGGRGWQTGGGSMGGASGRKEPAEDARDPPLPADLLAWGRGDLCQSRPVGRGQCTGAGGSEGGCGGGSAGLHTFPGGAPGGQWGPGPTPSRLHCAGCPPSRLRGTWKWGLGLSHESSLSSRFESRSGFGSEAGKRARLWLECQALSSHRHGMHLSPHTASVAGTPPPASGSRAPSPQTRPPAAP